MVAIPAPPAGADLSPVDLSGFFNDRVTQIFRNEYRAVLFALRLARHAQEQGLGVAGPGASTTSAGRWMTRDCGAVAAPRRRPA